MNELAALPITPATHFRLWYHTAALQAAGHLAAVGGPEALDRFPFIAGYLADVQAYLPKAGSLPALIAAWREAVSRWEDALPAEAAGWPLNRLLASGLGPAHLMALALAGLAEEDARFGPLYATLHPFPDEQRLTVGLLDDLLHADGHHAGPGGWAVANETIGRGLLVAAGRDLPRAAWPLRVPGPVWDALHGERPGHAVPGMRLYEPEAFPTLAELRDLHPADVTSRLARAPELLADGTLNGLILRGMAGSGRLRALGAVARGLCETHVCSQAVCDRRSETMTISKAKPEGRRPAPSWVEQASCGKGLLLLERFESAAFIESRSVGAESQPGRRGGAEDLEERFRLLGPLATLLGAMPAIELELAPGETATLPRLPGYEGPIGVILGNEGSVQGPDFRAAVTLRLPPPRLAARRTYWGAVLGDADNGNRQVIEQISARFHLTGGGIEQSGRLAQAYAALDGRGHVSVADVQEACRALNRQTLDALATRVETGGTWDDLVVSAATAAELRNLMMRCRQREAVLVHLGPGFGAGINRGVRALFSGPSGTGKTLAGRILAAELGLDLYRVDLAAVVNKYVGETERNLSRLFARAEEQDVILLLDEGDALLTGRTDVRSSNDRYANLETNYLLQRLETYEGILVVTTNAVNRVDSAFQRRMDVHVEFSAPDAAQRYAIWRRHLPRDGHQIDEEFLWTAAARCALSGGQIRNSALHATVLALEADQPLNQANLAAAIAREYRKMGANSPLALATEMGV